MDGVSVNVKVAKKILRELSLKIERKQISITELKLETSFIQKE